MSKAIGLEKEVQELEDHVHTNCVTTNVNNELESVIGVDLMDGSVIGQGEYTFKHNVI